MDSFVTFPKKPFSARSSLALSGQASYRQRKARQHGLKLSLRLPLKRRVNKGGVNNQEPVMAQSVGQQTYSLDANFKFGSYTDLQEYHCFSTSVPHFSTHKHS